MTSVQWLRKAAPVDVLELTTPADLDRAQAWLTHRRVRAVVSGDRLHMQGHDGHRATARCGQRLTYNPATGQVLVLDEPVFLADHEKETR